MQATARRVVEEPGAWPELREGVRGLFDQIAPQWDTIASQPGHLDGLKAALDHVRGVRCAADLGTGSGRGAELIASRFPSARVTGVDLSAPMAREAQKLANERLAFVVGDGSALPLRSGSLDLVVTLNMFVFVDEVKRVLGRGGRLVIVYSGGDKTPIYVPTDVLRSRLAGFEVEEGRAGDAIFIVAST